MRKLRHVIVGVDFSPRSLKASQMAVMLARQAGAVVQLVHVCEVQPTDRDALILGRSVEQLGDMLVEEARTQLEQFAAQLGYADVETTVVRGYPARELGRIHEQRQADLLVVGDTGSRSTVTTTGVGVNTYRLVEHGPPRMLIARVGFRGEIAKVAAAIDYEDLSDAVIGWACTVCHYTGAELRVIHAYSDTAINRMRLVSSEPAAREASDRLKEENERRLRDLTDQHRVCDLPTELVVMPGSPSSVIPRYLQDENIDMVVLGPGTSFRIAGYPIGSTTHTILSQSLASILIVRTGE